MTKSNGYQLTRGIIPKGRHMTPDQEQRRYNLLYQKISEEKEK